MKTALMFALLLRGCSIAYGIDSPWCAPAGDPSINQEYNHLLDTLRTQENIRRLAHETNGFPLLVHHATAICTTTNGICFIGGLNGIQRFAADEQTTFMNVTGKITCIAYGDGVLFAGIGSSIVSGLYGSHLKPILRFGQNSVLTAMVVTRDYIYAADAGQRLIHKLTRDGSKVESFGARDAARAIDGFIVPSPYFSLCMGFDGLLRVANPGRHRVEAWTLDGDYEYSWGTAGNTLEGFCGCCNPSYIAMFSDGRFVTSEKGLRRVKLFSADGRFIGICAGGRELGTDTDPLPVAIDSRGRILLLDDAQRKVRIFVPLQ